MYRVNLLSDLVFPFEAFISTLIHGGISIMYYLLLDRLSLVSSLCHPSQQPIANLAFAPGIHLLGSHHKCDTCRLRVCYRALPKTARIV